MVRDHYVCGRNCVPACCFLIQWIGFIVKSTLSADKIFQNRCLSCGHRLLNIKNHANGKPES